MMLKVANLSKFLNLLQTWVILKIALETSMRETVVEIMEEILEETMEETVEEMVEAMVVENELCQTMSNLCGLIGFVETLRRSGRVSDPVKNIINTNTTELQTTSNIRTSLVSL
ncbi:hypothetical protein PO909_015986 [Leuciscus waleckii]